ncbi:acetate/propionate family kinase [Aidingimonas halophila]|uniref:Acetate kinase n=1 Tax=Aidingimonas halophila TaxID=574349 RepID=A0A1H3BTZ0_9GAMM|nr:acetate/propionate family kinase [Aidingimonas halophila]GHC27141.1 acetate kinase [Aidingimonas halophila]SDX45353.1 acetate kinase [Aidingimonas halophila]
MSSVLVINTGSSSLKFGIYADQQPVIRGVVERVGSRPTLTLSHDNVDGDDFPAAERGHKAAASALLDWLDSHEYLTDIQAIGHRVVHGGQRLQGPVLLDATVRDYLASLIPLAPLHQPQALAIAEHLQDRYPELPHVVCVDTAFHRTQPWVNQQFALPRHLMDNGILRYGFHGLSYASIARRLGQYLGEKADGRIIVAHLGQGCSLCALHRRQSQATSMGFTALDGLMMGRRCGSLDPGVILYLQRQQGWSADAVEHMLYHDSGLYGVSELSDDLRDLEVSDDPKAQQAIDLFINRVTQGIGALCALLEGLDALVFTAGIGEHSHSIRNAVCRRLAWLGIRIDDHANECHASRIDAGRGPAVLVIPTDEEEEIAIATRRMAAYPHPGPSGRE